MISGVIGNFIFEKFAKNYQISGLLNEKLYQLTVVDETFFNQDEKMVKKKTQPLRTQINDKNLRQTVFDLVSIPHETILEIF